MEWNDTMRPCVSFLPIYNGFLDILEFKEVELHMVGGNSKEDCQANNLAVCDWLADKLARHGFVGQSHRHRASENMGSDATIGSVLLRCFDYGNSNSAANVQDDCFCAIGNIRSDFGCWQRICRRFSYKLLVTSRQLAIW